MSEKYEVLVAEDDANIRRMLVILLKANGYAVIDCENGEDALKAFYESKPDLIISDIAMPRMNGKELCRIIRRDYSEDLIPFIFLTAQSEISDKREGFELGADDYIVKPFDTEELILRVKAKLDRTIAVRKLTSTDELTGVYNRRVFDEKLNEMIRFANRYSREFSVAFLDIDHFKKVNDQYGHRAGDFLLKNFAKFILMNVREVDRVFRVGGDEFAILIFEKPKKEAFKMLDRLNSLMAEKKFFDPHSKVFLQATVSTGIAGFPQDATGGEDLVRLADAAMYEAKKAGRDRICMTG